LVLKAGRDKNNRKRKLSVTRPREKGGDERGGKVSQRRGVGRVGFSGKQSKSSQQGGCKAVNDDGKKQIGAPKISQTRNHVRGPLDRKRSAKGPKSALET